MFIGKVQIYNLNVLLNPVLFGVHFWQETLQVWQSNLQQPVLLVAELAALIFLSF